MTNVSSDDGFKLESVQLGDVTTPNAHDPAAVDQSGWIPASAGMANTSDIDLSVASASVGSEEIILDPQPVPDPEPIPDTRLYVPEHDEWQVHIKRDSEKMYCYAKLPGEDWFHMLLNGEIYVSRQHEKYCLRCALRSGFLTEDRLFWQHRVPKRPHRMP